MKLEGTRFKFDEGSHKYTLDGKPLTGVTTVLGVIAKPALIAWAANEAVKYVKEHEPKLVNVGGQDLIIYTPAQLHDLLEAARKAHTAKRDTSADLGTLAHAWIEKFAKGKNPKPVKKIAFITDNFVKWATNNDIRFVESEVRLYSEKFWYAGTMDLIYTKGENPDKFIADVKTQNALYDRTPFAQMAGYQIALEEHGILDIKGRTIIRCGKDGSFEVKESLDFDTDKKIFLACLDLYRGLKTY